MNFFFFLDMKENGDKEVEKKKNKLERLIEYLGFLPPIASSLNMDRNYT